MTVKSLVVCIFQYVFYGTVEASLSHSKLFLEDWNLMGLLHNGVAIRTQVSWKLLNQSQNVKGKDSYQQLHHWHIDSGKPTAAGHLVCKYGEISKRIPKNMRRRLPRRKSAPSNMPGSGINWKLGVSVVLSSPFSVKMWDQSTYSVTIIDAPG